MLGAIMGPGKFCGTSPPNGAGPDAFAGASKVALKRHQATVQHLSVPLKRVPVFLVCLIRVPFLRNSSHAMTRGSNRRHTLQIHPLPCHDLSSPEHPRSPDSYFI